MDKCPICGYEPPKSEPQEFLKSLPKPLTQAQFEARKQEILKQLEAMKCK